MIYCKSFQLNDFNERKINFKHVKCTSLTLKQQQQANKQNKKSELKIISEIYMEYIYNLSNNKSMQNFFFLRLLSLVYVIWGFFLYIHFQRPLFVQCPSHSK